MSNEFKLFDVDYECIKYVPKPKAKYGLGITWWHTNVNELIFFLEYIDKSWYNKELIDISICSYANLTPEQLALVEPLCSYIVKAKQDMGKEHGTMSHLNGALYPLFSNLNLVTITHVDADEVILNAQYFFGLSNMLLDSDKAILNMQLTYMYDMDNMSEYLHHDKEDWTKRLNHFIIFNRSRIPFGSYYPIPPKKDFHKDLWDHFITSGFTREDIFMLKRKVFSSDVPPNFLRGFNFTTGCVHATNVCEYPENEDRKIRLLRLMGVSAWKDMPEGFKWHVNDASPSKGYKILPGPPDSYEPILYERRKNGLQ